MNYGLKYEISPNNSFWLDVSGIINSKNTVITASLCTNEFKSAVNTLTFTLTGNVSVSGSAMRESVINMLMEALEEGSVAYVRLSRNDTAIFTGIIDLSSFSVASTKVEGDFSISCRDLSALHLDDVIDKHLFYEERKVSEVVSMLLSEAGYSAGKNEMADADDYEIPAFVVDPDEGSDTYRDVIDTLLFEAGGYTVSANNEGVMDIIKIPSTPPEERPEGIDYAVSSGLSSKSSMLDNDGVKLEWSTLGETDENQTVYVDSSISRSVDDEGNVVGLEIPAQGYFPEDGDITPSYQEFDAKLLDREYNTGVSRKQNKDLTIICVRDVKAEIIAADVNGYTVDNDQAWEYPVLPSLGMEKNPAIWPLKAWYLLRNKYGSVLNLQQFVLHGRVLYRNKVFFSTVPAAAKNPEEYTSTYIFTQEHAERFAKFYWHFRKYSRVVNTWTEYEYSARKEGDIVTINHKGTSTGQAAVIVQRSITFEAGRTKTEFTALSIGAFAQYEVKSWGSSPNYNLDKPADPLMPRRQYTLFPSPNVEDLFTTAIIYSDDDGNSWFLIDDAAVISESVTDADWQKDMPEYVPDGYYIFCREWNYETGKWDYYRMTGEVGSPARGFTVTSNPATYYNSRRRKGSLTIEIEVSLLNLSQGVVIEYILNTLGVSISGNVVTIPEGVYPSSISVDVIVTDLETSYGPATKNITIMGQDAEDSRPLYIGPFPADPNPDAFSYNFAEGDFYWNTNTLLAMRYSMNEEGELHWRIAENGDSNYSEIMGAVTAEAFSNIEPGSTSMAQFGYFQNILAEYIRADMIETMSLTLRNGGSIRSDGYNKGDINLASTKTGFYLDYYGYSEFQDVRIRNLEATGSFSADALRTINNIPLISYEQVLPQYQEEWKECSAAEATDAVVTDNAVGEIEGIVNIGNIYLGITRDDFAYYTYFRSVDGGNTWEVMNLEYMLDQFVCGIKVTEDRFVALVSDRNGAYHVAVSEDGVSWSYYACPSNYTCYDIAYGSGKFVVTARYNVHSSTIETKLGILSSENLSSWSFKETSSGSIEHPVAPYSHIAYGAGGFVVVGDDGLYRCNSDTLDSWTKCYTFSVPAPSYSEIYFIHTDRYLVVFNSNGNGYVLTSSDGASWGISTLLIDGILAWPTAVHEGSTYYYAISDCAAGTEHRKVFLSTNTVSWTPRTISKNSKSAAYMQNGVYLAFSNAAMVFFGSLALPEGIYAFFSSIRPKLDTSKVDMPLAEPLVNARAVTGGLEYNGMTYSIEQMRCSDNEIAFRVAGRQDEILFVATGAYPPSIKVKNLRIEQISGELQTGNMYPMDDAIETNIGSAEHPYENATIKHINSETLEGDLTGDVEGDVKGDVTGNLTGNVNSLADRNDYAVWGAVFN